MGFHIEMPEHHGGEPSRSDGMMVRLQPTESDFDQRYASRQRRLVPNRRRALGVVGMNRSSLRDARAFGRLAQGPKPPGYHHVPLRGHGPIRLYKDPVLRPVLRARQV